MCINKFIFFQTFIKKIIKNQKHISNEQKSSYTWRDHVAFINARF